MEQPVSNLYLLGALKIAIPSYHLKSAYWFTTSLRIFCSMCYLTPAPIRVNVLANMSLIIATSEQTVSELFETADALSRSTYCALFGGSIMGLLVPRQKPKWAQFPSWDHILGPISETWLKLLLVPSGLFWYPIVKSPILVRKRSQNTNLVWKFFEISKISWPPRACVFYWTYDGHM